MKKIATMIMVFVTYAFNVNAYSYNWYGTAALNNGENASDFTLFDGGYAYLIRIDYSEETNFEVRDDMTIRNGRIVDSTRVKQGEYSGSWSSTANDAEEYYFAIMVATDGKEGNVLPVSGSYGVTQNYYHFREEGESSAHDMSVTESVFANRMVAVPEPTSLMMIMVGLAVVALKRNPV